MFTIKQIDDIHDRFGRAEALRQYAEALNDIGIIQADSYVTDGHSEFIGSDGHTVKSPAAHGVLSITKASDKESFLKHLDQHAQHKTSYVEMSKGLAESGIEKWTIDTNKMTMTFYDHSGKEMLVQVL